MRNIYQIGFNPSEVSARCDTLPTITVFKMNGLLMALSSYFNWVLMFLRLENTDSSPTTELYKQMFAAQFSIHESAILDIYFRYEQVEHNENWFTNETAIELCAQRMQFPETFDIENASFCKNVN